MQAALQMSLSEDMRIINWMTFNAGIFQIAKAGQPVDCTTFLPLESLEALENEHGADKHVIADLIRRSVGPLGHYKLEMHYDDKIGMTSLLLCRT